MNATHDDPATILVVEDDDATRTFLADNLSADGYDLLVADCASIGLSLIERKFPDLALVDVGLPDASGFELLRRVRGADGVASRIEPRHAADGHQRPRDRARPRPRLRSRRGRLRLQAVLLSGAARARRGAAAPRRPPAVARAPARRRRWRSTRRRARCACTASASRCRRRSSRCCARSSSEPTRVFTKEELLRTIWGYRSRGIDAHAGLARLPAAPQARRPRRPLRRQRLGGRLPAGRCPAGARGRARRADRGLTLARGANFVAPGPRTGTCPRASSPGRWPPPASRWRCSARWSCAAGASSSRAPATSCAAR